MNTNPEHEISRGESISGEMLSAYVDGELSGDELRQVEQSLELNPGLRQKLADVRAVGEELRRLPRVGLPPEFGSQVLKALEREMLLATPRKAAVEGSRNARSTRGGDGWSWSRIGIRILLPLVTTACVVAILISGLVTPPHLEAPATRNTSVPSLMVQQSPARAMAPSGPPREKSLVETGQLAVPPGAMSAEDSAAGQTLNFPDERPVEGRSASGDLEELLAQQRETRDSIAIVTVVVTPRAGGAQFDFDTESAARSFYDSLVKLRFESLTPQELAQLSLPSQSAALKPAGDRDHRAAEPESADSDGMLMLVVGKEQAIVESFRQMIEQSTPGLEELPESEVLNAERQILQVAETELLTFSREQTDLLENYVEGAEKVLAQRAAATPGQRKVPNDLPAPPSDVRHLTEEAGRQIAQGITANLPEKLASSLHSQMEKKADRRAKGGGRSPGDKEFAPASVPGAGDPAELPAPSQVATDAPLVARGIPRPGAAASGGEALPIRLLIRFVQRPASTREASGPQPASPSD